jgi:hypothetical protein
MPCGASMPGVLLNSGYALKPSGAFKSSAKSGWCLEAGDAFKLGSAFKPGGALTEWCFGLKLFSFSCSPRRLRRQAQESFQ